MNLPRHDYVTCLSPSGLHRMAYAQWGDPHNPRILVCAHGLTRSRKDFYPLAQRLSKEFRVICPDVVGRGASDWLSDPNYYVVPQYVADMTVLLARLNSHHIYWLGTSMGGLIGMTLASLGLSPIQKLLINDVGPRIESAGLERIASYTGKPATFASFSEATNYTKEIAATFGEHAQNEWELLTESVFHQNDHGVWELNYDPQIAKPFRTAYSAEVLKQAELAMWHAYDNISCPTLLVRGQQSDILSAATAHEMTQRGPRPKLVEIANVGHAPTFFNDEQIEIASKFFLNGE